MAAIGKHLTRWKPKTTCKEHVMAINIFFSHWELHVNVICIKQIECSMSLIPLHLDTVLHSSINSNTANLNGYTLQV